MRIEHENNAAVICRHAMTGRWIICREQGNMVEGDDLAANSHGQFRNKKDAILKARRMLRAAAVAA